MAQYVTTTLSKSGNPMASVGEGTCLMIIWQVAHPSSCGLVWSEPFYSIKCVFFQYLFYTIFTLLLCIACLGPLHPRYLLSIAAPTICMRRLYPCVQGTAVPATDPQGTAVPAFLSGSRDASFLGHVHLRLWPWTR